MPCPYRLKLNKQWFCGARVPLMCQPDICPFGELYYFLVSNDKMTEIVWLMPRREKMRVEEAFEHAKNDANAYIVKAQRLRALGLKRGRRRG